MHLRYKSLNELAEVICEAKVEFNRLPGVKPVFRLHPPSKGFKGKVKRSYTAGGVTGYRGENKNNLIKNDLVLNSIPTARAIILEIESQRVL